MNKQNLFYVFKFSSSRLRKAKYAIQLDIDQGRKNGEVVSINQNQVITSILRLKEKEFDSDKLKKLFQSRKKIRKFESTPDTITQLLNIENEINDLIFVPDIVAITMDNKKHYSSLIANGFKVNGVSFVRLLCGAGHARRNTVIFCSQEIEQPLKELLNNGRHITDMVLAKNNAYFALAYSGTMPVSEPYFCVVPDYETK